MKFQSLQKEKKTKALQIAMATKHKIDALIMGK